MIVAPDALFPTDNDLGIPLLTIAEQADFVDLPVRAWGSISRKSSMRGTWHFYTGQDRFSALWKHPEAMQKTRAVTSVEPGFYLDDDMSIAVGAYRIYQKRWVARYWQEMGTRVFADLTVPEKFQKLNLMGLPDGWRSVAIDCDGDLGLLQSRIDFAQDFARIERLRVLVFGKDEETRELCGKQDWVFVEK